MEIKNPNYELVEQRRIEDLNSEGFLLRHKKTGARLLLLSNDDENKVFHIAFRTPPADDTGVAHIVEHSVLCGSEKYPVKDPFVELCKGSLNTFLNAMTYPDKTIYPVASCNDTDFKNIMDVYMDAVFHPNMYIHDEIFRQEGWHYEAESVDGPIIYNGVVYNEMKGAFSDPDDLLTSYTFKCLYPDNAYGKESGGDPVAIPTLSYEQFLDFHRRYYHPSNSYIYLYGNMDMNERLAYLDEEYLSKYDAQPVDSHIEEQKAFPAPVHKVYEYAVTEEEELTENAYLSYNVVVGNVLDAQKYIAFQILEYALISAPGAPLKKALTEAGIGTDIYGSYENSIYQPYFSIVAKNADENRQEEFERIIFETLTKIVTEGINQKAFLAGINYFEFKYREADFGSYPRGLMLGLQAMDSWLYDDNAPFLHIESGAVFTAIRDRLDKGYFEKLILEYFLENRHAAYVTLVPRLNLNEKNEKALEDKLKQYKESLTDAQIEKIVSDTISLKAYQDEPSSQEDLETIPMLSRADIRRKAAPVYIDEKKLGDVTTIHSNLFTSKIAYVRLCFECKYVEDEQLPYLALLQNVFGAIDTEEHEYFELFNEINIHTGGIVTGSTVYTNERDFKKYRICHEVKTKVLYDKLPKAFELMGEVLFSSRLDDHARLKEIIAQLRSRLQSRISEAGHTAAISQSMAEFSESIYYTNKMSGIDFYKFLIDLDDHFEERKEELSRILKDICARLYCRENLVVSITADEEGYQKFAPVMEQFLSRLPKKVDAGPAVRHFTEKNVKTGYLTSSQVNYVARTGNFVRDGFSYSGALKVLRLIFSYDYLWIHVRVKGGAYGCMSGFYRNGDSYMVSYRDPNIGKTNEIYGAAVDYVKNFDVSERDMTKYVIGTIGDMDTPMNPAAKGNYSFSFYMSEASMETIQKERDQVINATVADIRNLWPLIESVMKHDHLCVVGNAEHIRTEGALFDEQKTLN